MTHSARVTLAPSEQAPVINPNLYGHFAEHLGHCIYGGIWVGEDAAIPNVRGIRSDVVQALRALEVPVLRWPGGCFADEYHWRDGIGPRSERASMINTHWGGVVENNHFGTHEFMDLCEQIGAEPYVCGNVGSGSVQEMMEWVEYLTAAHDSPVANLRRKNGRDAPWSLKYFGVGNESWGCGGNMRPDFYADNYRRYATFVKNHSGNRLARFACGANGSDYEWTEVLMSRAGALMDGLSLHHYTLPTGNWSQKGSAVDFDEVEWHSTFVRALHMRELLEKHGAIMDRFDPERRVGLIVDEWGLWCDVEPGTNPGFLRQQSTLRDALVAAVHFNLFNQHAARVTMANIAQTVNVLHAVILTDGPRMLLTPTYHVFEMYRVHQGARLVPLELETPEYVRDDESVPALHASASRDASGRTHVSLANLDPGRALSVELRGITGKVSGRVLSAERMNAHNTFAEPSAVQPAPFAEFSVGADSIVCELPAKSLLAVTIEE
jgi:alpha-N-arabinofuranosidase